MTERVSVGFTNQLSGRRTSAAAMEPPTDGRDCADGNVFLESGEGIDANERLAQSFRRSRLVKCVQRCTQGAL